MWAGWVLWVGYPSQAHDDVEVMGGEGAALHFEERGGDAQAHPKLQTMKQLLAQPQRWGFLKCGSLTADPHGVFVKINAWVSARAS